jgi:hypothetical protein
MSYPQNLDQIFFLLNRFTALYRQLGSLRYFVSCANSSLLQAAGFEFSD